MKTVARWHSERVGREVTLARWGEVGTPVLIFPTAGGDAEEIERFLVMDVLSDLLAQGRIKVYSCDSVAGQAWFERGHSPEHRMWLQNQFHHYVRDEVVPAIHRDCNSSDIGIIAAGASIGAFHAVAMVCRFPDVFSRALAMSGSFWIERFIDAPNGVTDAFRASSPHHFLRRLPKDHLAKVRQRFILLASGDGRAENMGETWAMANALGALGIPNRVDPWGPDWHHDWPTWRRMLPQYLGEWTKG